MSSRARALVSLRVDSAKRCHPERAMREHVVIPSELREYTLSSRASNASRGICTWRPRSRPDGRGRSTHRCRAANGCVPLPRLRELRRPIHYGTGAPDGADRLRRVRVHLSLRGILPLSVGRATTPELSRSSARSMRQSYAVTLFPTELVRRHTWRLRCRCCSHARLHSTLGKRSPVDFDSSVA